MDGETGPAWRRYLREWVRDKHDGKKLPAAKELGITVVTLRKLLTAEPPPVPHTGTIRLISSATGVSVPHLLYPFESDSEMMDFIRRTDYLESFERSDRVEDVLDCLPEEAVDPLREFVDWAGRRGVDDFSLCESVYNLILWPLRPDSYLVKRYWGDQQLRASDLVRIVRHGVQISKVLLAPSLPERRKNKKRKKGR